MQLLSCTIIYSNSIQRLSQQWVNTMNSGTAGENKEAEKRTEREREREREREGGRNCYLPKNCGTAAVHLYTPTLEKEKEKKKVLSLNSQWKKWRSHNGHNTAGMELFVLHNLHVSVNACRVTWAKTRQTGPPKPDPQLSQRAV